MRNSPTPPADVFAANHANSLLLFEQGQTININKPADWTSFDVVKKIRSAIRVKKVGHAGTLDPFATGVLLVCTGKETKKVDRLMGLEKEYLATIELGVSTDSYDRTGATTHKGHTDSLTRADIVAACMRFQGEILQTPPMYSALKVNGQRLYKLARKGISVARAPRKVVIHQMNILAVDLPHVTVSIVCSKGTYIRSLAHDIGEALGCGGHLSELQRTRIGDYSIEDATAVPAFLNSVRRLQSTA